MIRQLIIIFILFVPKLYGQCGQEYPSGFYHNSEFINTQGDTLNKLDHSGFYEGLHLYSLNKDSLYNDTVTYIIGKFNHGKPIGDWKEHCKDGTYSIGEYESGIECKINSDGKWTKKKQGIYVKIGDWKNFDKDNKLTGIEKFERSILLDGLKHKIYKADSLGNLNLTKFESQYFIYFAKIRTKTTKTFSERGLPSSYYFYRNWKTKTYEFNTLGQLTKTIKSKTRFKRRVTTTIEFSNNKKRQRKCKTKSKCRISKPFTIYNESW